MKRGRRILLILLACWVVAVVAAVVWPREREPVYRGRSLSQWIMRGSKVGAYQVSAAESQEAEEAIRQIGTNALPFLVKWLGFEKSGWQVRVAGFDRRLPARLRDSSFMQSLDGRKGEFRRTAGLFGFKILGPRASPAIPELSRLLNGAKGLDVSERALLALLEIGGEAFPALAAALRNQNIPFRGRVVTEIGRMRDRGAIAASAVPVLIECLRDNELIVRGTAAVALGELGVQPEAVVPALENAADDVSPPVRLSCVVALGRFGEHGRAAVPLLVRFLSDPNWGMRSEATNALQKIAPEVLLMDALGDVGHGAGKK